LIIFVLFGSSPHARRASPDVSNSIAMKRETGLPGVRNRLISVPIRDPDESLPDELGKRRILAQTLEILG
jgi:hypothetical protein